MQADCENVMFLLTDFSYFTVFCFEQRIGQLLANRDYTNKARLLSTLPISSNL